MNLRQQFFWKLLLIISSLAIILSLWRVYDKYDQFSKYETTITNKDTEQINKNIQLELIFSQIMPLFRIWELWIMLELGLKLNQ